jgi:hypothetical protein
MPLALSRELHATLRHVWFSRWASHQTTLSTFATQLISTGLGYLVATECPPHTLPGSLSTKRQEPVESGYGVGVKRDVLEKCAGVAQCYRPTLDARGTPKIVTDQMVARWALRIALKALLGTTPEK